MKKRHGDGRMSDDGRNGRMPMPDLSGFPEEQRRRIEEQHKRMEEQSKKWEEEFRRRQKEIEERMKKDFGPGGMPDFGPPVNQPQPGNPFEHG